MNSFPGTNVLLTGIFLFCLGTLAMGAILAVFSTRLIRSVCGLALCCVGLAGLYYFLHSPFLALMEILIYVGAVCVTIVFAIMLAEPDEPPNQEGFGARMIWGGAAALVALSIFGGFSWLGMHHSWSAPESLVTDGSITAIGISLLTTYSLAFELISLALLVAILGALVIARTGRTSQPATSVYFPSNEPRPQQPSVRELNGNHTSERPEPAGVLVAMSDTRMDPGSNRAQASPVLEEPRLS